MKPNDKSTLLSMVNLVPFEGKYYFWAKNGNGFFSYDRDKEECELLAQEETQDVYDKLRYSKGILVEGFIVFTPYWSKKIFVYNPVHNTIKFIPSEKLEGFAEICAYQGWIYFWKAANLARMRLHDWEIEFLQSDQDMVCNHICQTDNFVYTLSRNSDEFMRIDLEDNSVKKYKTTNIGIKFNIVTRNGRDLFFGGDQPVIVRWNIDSEEVKVYKIPEECHMRNDMKTEYIFNTVGKIGDKIFFSPAKADSFVSFDLMNERLDIELRLRDYETWGFIIPFDDEGVLITDRENTVYEVAHNYKVYKDGNIEEKRVLKLSQKVKMKLGRWESLFNSLDRFIYSLPTNTLEKKMIENYETGSDTGRRIGDAIKALYV